MPRPPNPAFGPVIPRAIARARAAERRAYEAEAAAQPPPGGAEAPPAARELRGAQPPAAAGETGCHRPCGT